MSLLPGSNQHFDEIEPIVEENGSDDEMIIEQTTNVATRRRRPPSKVVQACDSIPERERRATRSDGIVQGNTVTGADDIQIDSNQAEHAEGVERMESRRISTRSRNINEFGSSLVRRRVRTNVFNRGESDDAPSSSSEEEPEHEHLSISVDVEVHGAGKTTSMKLASLSTAKVSNSTNNATTTTADDSSLTHEHSQKTEAHSENRTTEMAVDKSAEVQQSSCSNDTSSDSSRRFNRVDGSSRLRVQANNQQINNVSVSSSSFDLTPLPIKDEPTASTSILNANRLTKTKTKVGFNASCFVHEKSTSSVNTSHESAKIVMKGGKWRRTIVEIRKNKSSQRKFVVCPMILINQLIKCFLMYLSVGNLSAKIDIAIGMRSKQPTIQWAEKHFHQRCKIYTVTLIYFNTEQD